MMKIQYVTILCTFPFPMPFSQVNLHKYDKVSQTFYSVNHSKTCFCFSKTCKAKTKFFTNFWMTRNSDKKNNSYNTTAVQNDKGYKSKKM